MYSHHLKVPFLNVSNEGNLTMSDAPIVVTRRETVIWNDLLYRS